MNIKAHKTEKFVWLDLLNPSQEELESLEVPFDIDSRYFVDVLDEDHLPKKEETPRYTFLILRAYDADVNQTTIDIDEITSMLAFFKSDKYLITIHKSEFDFLKGINKNDYKSVDDLYLYLINEVLETYEQPLENQGDKMDQMEREVFLGGNDNLSIKDLYYEKTTARILKRVLMLTDGVLDHLNVSSDYSSTLEDIRDSATEYLLQADEVMADATNILNSFMTVTAQKNNDVMQLLTIFSVFFLPISFIAGWFGMNFKYMPFLQNPNGYYYTIGSVILISILIFVWFKRKKIL